MEAEHRRRRIEEARKVSRERECASTSWFALFTNPRCELRVELGAIEAGFCAYTPEGTKFRRCKGAPNPVARRFCAFPRYVFIGATGQMPWHTVRGLDGVKAVVGQANAPVRISSHLLADYRAAQDMGALDARPTPHAIRQMKTLKTYTPENETLVLKPNDLVLIVSGPLEGHHAVVRRPSTGSAAQVELMSWLNGMAHVSLDRLRVVA